MACQLVICKTIDMFLNRIQKLTMQLSNIEMLYWILPFYKFVFFSVPTFKNLPEESVSKIADVLEEVR